MDIKSIWKNEYNNVAYINCDKVTSMRSIFSDFDTQRLIRAFSAITDELIKPGETLIVLDEIQEAPLGLTALKYFCEDANEYHIIVAGSLLGIKLHSGTGYPVGKTELMKMYPMSFSEFLMASGNNVMVELLKEHNWNELSLLADKFKNLLRQYYFVGGMPEVVNTFFTTDNLQEVRRIQKRILSDYEADFSKHIPAVELSKVQMLWNSIPSQLAKKQKKFVYGVIKKGARAKEFENAIQWLLDAGLVYKVIRVNKVLRPLKFYEDVTSFKLFFSDLGLLGAKVDVTAKEVLTGENYLSEYKGAFTEQFVAGELISAGYSLYYYSKESSTLKIDFIVQKNEVYPIEVKAEENLKSKSLKTIYDENNFLKPCRFSMSNYREQEWMINVPLYLAREWIENID